MEYFDPNTMTQLVGGLGFPVLCAVILLRDSISNRKSQEEYIHKILEKLDLYNEKLTQIIERIEINNDR